MPQILHPDGSDDPRRAEEQFLDLFLSDEELLRAEFDAIIAADWSNPPSASPAQTPGPNRAHRGHRATCEFGTSRPTAPPPDRRARVDAATLTSELKTRSETRKGR